MMFGLLAFGAALLSYLAASASTRAHYQVRREDYGGYAMGAYLSAFCITMVPAFVSVVSGSIALVRGERSGWRLLPALV